LLSDFLSAFVEECLELQARSLQAAANDDWVIVAKSSHTLQAELRLFGGASPRLGDHLEGQLQARSTGGKLRSV